MSKKISVIIPVYNGEKYISRCIDSVISQKNFSVDDLEILIFNDGSQDGSLGIVKSFEKKYPGSIKVIDQQNSGVAKTRNKGIQLATGKYLIFIDQDDWIDEDYCNVLFDEIENGQYDAVFSGMKRPDEDGKIINSDIYNDNNKDTFFGKFMCMAVWAKIHRTSFLREVSLELFDNAFGEDIAFTFEQVQKTEKIKCISYCGYNWFANTQSVSNTAQRSLKADNIASIARLQAKIATADQRKNNDTTFFATMITAYYIFLAGRGSSVTQFMEGVEALVGNLQGAYPQWKNSKYVWWAPRGVLPVFSLGVKGFIVLYRLRLLALFARIYCRPGRHA